MPIESYPTFQESGAAVARLVRTRLSGAPDLNDRQLDTIAEYLGELSQKALEIQYVVNRCLATDSNDRAELADLLSTAEILATHIATWRDNAEDALLDAVDRLRQAEQVPA
jgi:hypothetical protein